MIIRHFGVSGDEMLSLSGFLSRLQHSNAVSHIARGIYDNDEIGEVGRWLASYAANHSDILEHICAELYDYPRFQTLNDFQPPSFILHKDERITVRMVIWSPQVEGYAKRPYSYGEPHDHNFDFWTVNFFGSGYLTRLFSYSYASVTGVTGESVPLRCHGDHTLSPGNVMFYTRSQDVHIQYPPDTLSASINVVVRPEQPPWQYEFSADELPASGTCESRITQGRFERYRLQRLLFGGLMRTGNAKSRMLIREVARCSEQDEIRAIALEAILECANQECHSGAVNDVVLLVSEEQSPAVRKRLAGRIRALKVGA